MARELVKTTNAFGVECFGYDLSETHGVVVFDPTVSECGRFKVNPVEHYGLSPDEVIRLTVANKGIDLYGAEET